MLHKIPSENSSGDLSRVGLFFNFQIFAIVFLIAVAYQKIQKSIRKQRSLAEPLRQFPSPPTLPILGNGHQMRFKATEFYSWAWNLCRKWGDGNCILTWRLSFPVMWVYSAEMALDLLNNPRFVAKSQDISLLYKLPGGNGLSGSPPHVHNSRRKLLLPGYSRQVVDRSMPIFSSESKRLLQTMVSYSQRGEVFEILEAIIPFNFRIVCTAALGEVTKISDSEMLEYMRAFHVVCVNFTNRIMSPYLWLRNDFLYYNFIQEGRTTWKNISDINCFGRAAIEKRQKIRQLRRDQQIPCYLDMLLDLKEKGDLPERDILGELNNFIVAAYDTTALTVAWTLFALASNDKVHQEKIVQELQEIFGNVSTEQWGMSGLQVKQMKYLELCIKEALRLYPTSPVTPRSCSEDVTLKDGRRIPAGTDVFIMVDMIQRDERYFEKPNEFWPERHLKTNAAFMPFSVGQRTCVGQNFGIQQVKVQLAYLVYEYHWETLDKWETLPRLFQGLLVPAEGIRFKICKREKSPHM